MKSERLAGILLTERELKLLRLIIDPEAEAGEIANASLSLGRWLHQRLADNERLRLAMVSWIEESLAQKEGRNLPADPLYDLPVRDAPFTPQRTRTRWWTK